MAVGVREPGGVPDQHQDPGPDRAGCLHSRGAAGECQDGFGAGWQSAFQHLTVDGWLVLAQGGVATKPHLQRGRNKGVFAEQLFSVKWLFGAERKQ